MVATQTSAKRRRITPAREVTSDNLAVVRMWWTVLESEWRTVLAEGSCDGVRGNGIVTPSIREALAAFMEFEACAQEFLTVGDWVVIALELHGRTRGCDTRLSMQEAWLCRVVEGAVVEVRDYSTVAEALRAAAAAVPAPA
jgi:ketosteroid isomerase-like protein